MLHHQVFPDFSKKCAAFMFEVSRLELEPSNHLSSDVPSHPENQNLHSLLYWF